MRPILRSPAPIALLIVAIPGIAIAYTTATGSGLRTSQLWFDAGSWAFFIAAAVAFVLYMLQRQPRVTLAGQLQRQTTVIFGWAFLIDSFAFLAAILWPGIGALISAIAAAWVILWSVPRLRRTRIVTSFVVHNTPGAVFAFISDARNLPRWRTETLSVEMLTPEPIGPGSRFRQHVRLPSGTEITGEDEYIDFEPNRRFTSQSLIASPNFDEMGFEAVGDGTRVTHRLDFEHSFASSVLGGMFTNASVNRQILASRSAGEVRVKQILESAPLQQGD